jgi:hypothetical protein
MDPLINQLLSSQHYPHPNLLRKISEMGDRAIPPLAAFLEQEIESDDERRALVPAILLLGRLGARQTLPALIQAMHCEMYTSDVYHAISIALRSLKAMEELIELSRDSSINLVARCKTLHALRDLAVILPEERLKITDTLSEMLTYLILHAPNITSDEEVLGEELMSCLALLGGDTVPDLLDSAGRAGIRAWAVLYMETYSTFIPGSVQIQPIPDWLDEYEREFIG